VSGVWNVNDQDWFKLNLPRPGKVTATVTGFPADCKMQVTGVKGSTGLGTGIGTVTFDAPAGEIYLKVFLNPYAAACHESDWCAVQCRKNGPWYLAPDKDGRPSQKVPTMHGGSRCTDRFLTRSASPSDQPRPRLISLLNLISRPNSRVN